MSIWIIGCGDIGRRLARLYQKDNIDARALVSSTASALQCQQLNLDTLIHDLDSNETLDVQLFNNAQLFYFVPPPKTGIVDTRLQKFLSQVAQLPRKIILISTTGVYGDSQGEWIDESFPLNPVADRAKRRLHAENTLQQWAKQYQKEIVILRVPGIYAKDRLPLQRLKKGLPVVKEDEAGWTNRIHADDLARICKRAMEITPASTLYNVSDGSPSTMTHYFNQIADFAGLVRPPQISMEQAIRTLSKGMVSYLKESRRIKNDKLLKELGITLKYPDLSSALR